VARLEDKIVLIAGAAGAIGQTVAAAVQREGGVAIATELGGRAGIDTGLDVTAESDWHNVQTEDGRAQRRRDGLVNAAGIALLGSIETPTTHRGGGCWRSISTAPSRLQARARAAETRGGSIVNLSSISGIVGGHNLAAYNASKGGVAADQVGRAPRPVPTPRGVSIAVPRAFLDCPMVDDSLAQTGRPEIARGQLARDIPLGRLGTPFEVADLCIYLLSDESRFVTGSEFTIDGGLTAR
jgi:NAD(P)-dependent dehydrogenase (short-subunit alcohol dehydrogenase family)